MPSSMSLFRDISSWYRTNIVYMKMLIYLFNYLINQMFELFSFDGLSAHKILTFEKKELCKSVQYNFSYNHLKNRLLLNNMISIESYVKKLRPENFHRPRGKLWTPYKIFSNQKYNGFETKLYRISDILSRAVCTLAKQLRFARVPL
jgi:hypothetical protein